MALYKPFGIAGIVIGTVVGTLVMTVAQGWLLRGQLGGIEGAKMLASGVRMLAAGALLAGCRVRRVGSAGLRAGPLAARPGWRRSGWASRPASASTPRVLWALRVPEARQIRALLPGGRR